MKEYSYTLAVDDLEMSKLYYETFFGWKPENENSKFVSLDTASPLTFSLIDKEYLLKNLGLGEDEIPTNSFCTWLYKTKEELNQEEDELVGKGLKRIGEIGHFLKDEDGILWELRVKGDLL